MAVNHAEFSARMIGRIGMTEQEVDALQSLLKHRGGIHIEIGTLWGATAILAALAKQSGRVITIDYMRLGYWVTGDPCARYAVPTPADILDNLVRFGVAHNVSVVKAPSYPWPIPASVKPTTTLIDGGHEHEPCLRDWMSVKDITRDYVIFHDYKSATCPGVTSVVDNVVSKDSDWQLKDVQGTLAVFKRV